MADHVQIRHSIWTDEDFLSLSWAAQHMYFLLLSQPDMNHAGVLVYRPRRWSKLIKGATAEDVEALLTELEAAWFIAIDHDAEELLVRSVIRIDEKHKQPYVFVAACKGVSGTLSRTLRGILRAELERLPLDELSESVRPKIEKQLFPLLRTLPEAIHKPSREPFAEPFPEGSPEGSAEPFTKPNGEGEEVSSKGSGKSESTKPKTAPPNADATKTTRQTRKDTPEGELASAIAKRFYDHVGGLTKFMAVKAVVLKAIKAGAAERAIVDALDRLNQSGRPITADTMRAELNGTRTARPTAVPSLPPVLESGRLEATPENWGLNLGDAHA